MTSCRACGADAPRHHDGGTVVLARCAVCGLVQLDDATPPVPPTFYEYYADRIGMSRDELHLALTTIRLQEMLDRLGSLVSGRRLLDVGCGEGHLVATAVERGWDAHGIDLSTSAIEICRGFGLPCTETDLFGDELRPGSFDVVTMIELIEHVDEPARFLQRAEELLAPGGVVHLTTPNHASLGRRVLGDEWSPLSPAHLTYFSPATLRALVRASTSLEVVRIDSRNLSAAALRRLLRRPAPTVVTGPGEHVGSTFAAEQRLRHQLERSRLRRTAKSLVNRVLAATGSGETLVAVLRRTHGSAGAHR